MPIYEYECRKCKAHSEVFQKLNDKPPTKCRKCGGRLERMISAPAIQFKGSGWYVTDYASKGSKEKRSQDKAAASGDKAESGTDKSESGSTTSSEKSDKKETSPTKKTSDKAPSTKTSSGD